MTRGDHVLSSPPSRKAATATSNYALKWGILKWPSMGDFGWPPGLRRFSYQRLGARVAITGDTLDRLNAEDREKLFEVLVKQIERDLSEDNEYWELESTRHSDSLKRGYFLELIGQVREAGETTRWLKYVLLLPKKDEQIVEVRLSAPLIEKAKYQADLDLINDSLRRWISG